jgi:hypothetical protein
MTDSTEFGRRAVGQQVEANGDSRDQYGTDQALFERGHGAMVCFQSRPGHQVGNH